MAADILRRLKIYFPPGKFPDPELSVDRHLQDIPFGPRHLHIWDAIGPAQGAFDQIKVKIDSRLKQFNNGTYAEVSYVLCMIGPEDKSTRPAIIFHDRNVEARKAVRAEIKRSGILKDYVGFILLDANRPPQFGTLISFWGGVKVEVQDSDMMDVDEEATTHLNIDGLDTRIGALEGARIVVQADDDKVSSMEQPKIGTVGGIVRSGENYFLMTAAHIFCEMEGLPGMEASAELEYDIDFDFDLSSDEEAAIDDPEMEGLSRASASPPSDDSGRPTLFDAADSSSN